MVLNKIANILIKNNLTISTTESCTGGLLSSALTDISGSSAFIHLNFVTYSNEAKNKILNVKNETLKQYGAVSEQTAYEMALGLYQATQSDICISTTGIAGPTGGSEEKPVGLMYSTILWGKTKDFKTYKILFQSDIPRIEMKQKFVEKVLDNLYQNLCEKY